MRHDVITKAAVLALMLAVFSSNRIYAQEEDAVAVYEAIIQDLRDLTGASDILITPAFTKFDKGGFARARGGQMTTANLAALIARAREKGGGARACTPSCPVDKLARETLRVSFSRIEFSGEKSETVMVETARRNGTRGSQVAYVYDLEKARGNWLVKQRTEVYSAHGVTAKPE